MKEKNVAGILALFLGGFGVHRFYLGQTGLGVFYLIFCWLPLIWILGLIDAIVFFSMDKEAFDLKYNRNHYQLTRKRDTDFDRHQRYREERERRRQSREYERDDHRRERSDNRQEEYRQPQPRPAAIPKPNPYKNSGIRKYKEYDYDGAVADFQKALEIDEKDVAVHFNIACAYSLNENVEKAFFHLDRAVALGFDDFKRIKEHDALAYIRIQDQFEEFEQNGFRLTMQLEAPKENLLDAAPSESTDLLEQLKKLGELREKGLLTEEEFVAQKKRLLE
jgi:TM2 domain-containing membrane protein YozV